MVPLPGSATRMSPAEVAAAELGLTNIGERLNVSVKSAAHTTRKQTRMEHLPMVSAFLQNECQTSARRLTIRKHRPTAVRAELNECQSGSRSRRCADSRLLLSVLAWQF